MQKFLTGKMGGFRLWKLLLGLGIIPAVTVALILAVAVTIGVSHRFAKREAAAPKVTAWQKLEPRLDQIDQAGAEVAQKHLQRIRGFFNEKKRGAKDFAEWGFSWRGKWHALKGKVQGDGGAGFRLFLQEKFGEHIFRNDELQAVLKSAIEGYVTEMEGLENDALVKIRADIAQDELFQGKVPELQTDEAFRKEYERLAQEVRPKVAQDLGVGVAGQLTSFVGSEIAGQVLGRSLIARMGLSGGGFWGAMSRSGVTIAVGALAWFAIDYVVEWILQWFGYGPEGELAAQVEQALDRMQLQLINGDPAAAADYERRRQMERDDPTPEGQAQFRQEADAIEQSGVLGLRREFLKLQEMQSRLRRAALRKMVSAQGDN